MRTLLPVICFLLVATTNSAFAQSIAAMLKSDGVLGQWGCNNSEPLDGKRFAVGSKGEAILNITKNPNSQHYIIRTYKKISPSKFLIEIEIPASSGQQMRTVTTIFEGGSNYIRTIDSSDSTGRILTRNGFSQVLGRNLPRMDRCKPQYLVENTPAVPPAPLRGDSKPESTYHYVANTSPPSAFLSLRTHPSTREGLRITAMPNGTRLQVLQRHDDGWWFVRMVDSGREGWALSGENNKRWIVNTAPRIQSAQSQSPADKKDATGGVQTPSSAEARKLAPNELSMLNKIQSATRCYSIGQDYTLAGTPYYEAPKVSIALRTVNDEIWLDEFLIKEMLIYLKEQARKSCEFTLKVDGELKPSISGFKGINRMLNAYVVHYPHEVPFSFQAYSDGADDKWVIVKNNITQRMQVQRADQKARLQAREEALDKQRRQAEAKASLRNIFLKQHSVSELISYEMLVSNPFVYKNKNVAVYGSFVRMISETEAVFAFKNQYIFVDGVPSTRFVGNPEVVLALKVVGTKQTSSLGGQLTMPHASFVGAHNCTLFGCQDFFGN